MGPNIPLIPIGETGSFGSAAQAVPRLLVPRGPLVLAPSVTANLLLDIGIVPGVRALNTWSVAPALPGDRGRLAAASGLGVVGVAAQLLQPWPLSIVVDHAVDDRPFTGVLAPLDGLSPHAVLLLAALATVALAALAGFLGSLEMVLAEGATERAGGRLRRLVFGDVVGLSLRWHDRHHSGEVVSRLTSDVGRVMDAVSVTVGLLPDVVLVVGVLVILASMDLGLALTGLLAIPILVALTIRQRRRLRAVEMRARAARGDLAANVTDLLHNIRAVQALGGAARADAVFDRHNQAMVDTEIEAISTSARWSPRADVVLAMGTGAVLLLGGHRVLTGALSVGTLIVLLSYLRSLYSPVRSLARASTTYAKARASDDRIHEVLRSAERIAVARDATPALDLTGAGIELRDISFAYSPRRPVLDHFDLTIRPGELVCVMGPSGAGKSTLLSLLLRLYDPDAGSVRIADTDIRWWLPDTLRRQLALVPQDPWLLDATIADNISFGNDASPDAIAAAADAARVSEFARHLPDGLETGIGEAGAMLSGGQRRRVAIARALASEAPILLLDEPTASLDKDAADAVVAAIRSASRGRTVVLVTHEPDVAAISDRVIHLPRLVPSHEPQAGRSTPWSSRHSPISGEEVNVHA